MAAGSTYTPVANYTVSGTSTSLITFNSFSGYTDLILRIQGTSWGNGRLRFNSDSGANYNWNVVTGDGTSAFNNRSNNDTSLVTGYYGGNGINFAQIMNYANSTTYKSVLTRASNAAVGTDMMNGTWRNTAAITTITVQVNATGSGTFANGDNITIWGIVAA